MQKLYRVEIPHWQDKYHVALALSEEEFWNWAFASLPGMRQRGEIREINIWEALHYLMSDNCQFLDAGGIHWGSLIKQQPELKPVISFEKARHK